MTLEEIEAKFRNNFEESYERYLKALEFIKTDELREEMKNRFLKKIEPYVNSYYHRDHIDAEIKMLEIFKSIRNKDIEFYLQYVLENYDSKNFDMFFYIIDTLAIDVGIVVSRICRYHAWYTGKKDTDRILENTFMKARSLKGAIEEEEIRKCIENVIEIETDYINACQKAVLNDKTYCEDCPAFCLERRIARKG